MLIVQYLKISLKISLDIPCKEPEPEDAQVHETQLDLSMYSEYTGR